MFVHLVLLCLRVSLDILLLLVGVWVGKRRPSIRKYLDILIWIWMLGSPVAGGRGGGW